MLVLNSPFRPSTISGKSAAFSVLAFALIASRTCFGGAAIEQRYPQVARNREHGHMFAGGLDAHKDHRLRQHVIRLKLRIVVGPEQQNRKFRAGWLFFFKNRPPPNSSSLPHRLAFLS